MAAHKIKPCAEFIWQYRCKQATCVYLGVSRYGYVYHDAAHRTRTCVKRRCDATPVSNFVVMGTTVLPLTLQHKDTRNLSSCCSVKGSRNNGRRADSPCCCRRHADTCLATNKLISWFKVRYVSIWSCKVDLIICLSFRALTVRGCWDLVWRSVWSSLLHLFHICMTLVGFQAMQVAVSRNDKPHYPICHDLAAFGYQHVLVADSPYRRHNTITQTTNIKMRFPSEKPAA